VARCGLWGGDSSTKRLFRAGAVACLADSGAEDMRIEEFLSGRASEFDLLRISAAGCRTLRTDSWWARVYAELSIVRLLRTENGEALRGAVLTVLRAPSVSESVLKRLFLSARLAFLCTSLWRGASSNIIELRFEWDAPTRLIGEPESPRKAMFLPEWRSGRWRCGGVVTTTAATTVEATEAVDMRLFLVSGWGPSGVEWTSAGQPIDCAKSSIEGLRGLLLLASTRSRRLELRRDPVLMVGEAAPATVSTGSSAFWGDESGLRFLRTVTFLINSVFHSRSENSSTTGNSLSSSAPATVSASARLTSSIVGLG
jgi:hypothetical protein